MATEMNKVVERDGFRRMSGEDEEMFKEPRPYDVSGLIGTGAGRSALHVVFLDTHILDSTSSSNLDLAWWIRRSE